MLIDCDLLLGTKAQTEKMQHVAASTKTAKHKNDQEAHLAKGNNNALLHRDVIENSRRNQSPIDEARAIKIALNNGQTKKEAANEYGVTVQTNANRLALLDLPLDQKRANEEGRFKKTVAVQKARNSSTPPRPKMRPRNVIEKAMSEFAEHRTEYKVLAWVLGKTENSQLPFVQNRT